MKKELKTYCVVFIFSLFLTVPTLSNASDIASASDITVHADGYGISPNDALLEAKREAISSGIGTMLISETEIKNFMLQKDLVLTRTIGAVKSYSILSSQKEGDTFHVKISAVVSQASIKQDLAALKILLESMDKPRMMVLIQEENGNSAETAIVDYLNEKEFELVDAASTAALMNKDDELILQAIAGNPLAAAKLGAANGAEYIISGRVAKSSSQNNILTDAGMKSGQAEITAKVVNCSNGKIIASKSAKGASIHISLDIAQTDAAAKAARKLMDRELFENIVSSFQDMVNNGTALDLSITNIPDYSTQKAVSEIIGGLEVVSLNKRGFDQGKLHLSVVFRGNADGFAEMIDGRQVSDKKLAVTSVIGNKIQIVLK